MNFKRIIMNFKERLKKRKPSNGSLDDFVIKMEISQESIQVLKKALDKSMVLLHQANKAFSGIGRAMSFGTSKKRGVGIDGPLHMTKATIPPSGVIHETKPHLVKRIYEHNEIVREDARNFGVRDRYDTRPYYAEGSLHTPKVRVVYLAGIAHLQDVKHPEYYHMRLDGFANPFLVARSEY